MGKKETGKREVLLVDASSQRNKVIRGRLGAASIDCISAENAENAKRVLNHRVPDLVIIDTELPDLAGTELCRWIRSKEWLGAVPVMMMSARHDLSLRIQGFLAGACRYLCRPFTAETLIEEVEILLSKQVSVASPRMWELETDLFEERSLEAY